MVVLIAERVTQRGLCAALVLSELKKTSQIPCELEGSVTIDRSYALPPPAETWHRFCIVWIQSSHTSRKQSHFVALLQNTFSSKNQQSINTTKVANCSKHSQCFPPCLPHFVVENLRVVELNYTAQNNIKRSWVRLQSNPCKKLGNLIELRHFLSH